MSELCGHGHEHGERGQVHTGAGWAPVGRPHLLTALPSWTRLRLTLIRFIDRIAIRLCDHGRQGTALRLWRATGLVK